MRRRATVVAAAVLTAAVTVAGCSRTVGGTAQRATRPVSDAGRSYGYADNRCGLLPDSSVQQTLSADKVLRPYSGSVCQYVLVRHGQMVDATFSWFESGSLAREKALAKERGEALTGATVEGHHAFLARRSATGPACAATAAAGTGVVSWWVQLRGQNNGDPCQDAQKLLSATLRSGM